MKTLALVILLALLPVAAHADSWAGKCFHDRAFNQANGFNLVMTSADAFTTQHAIQSGHAHEANSVPAGVIKSLGFGGLWALELGSVVGIGALSCELFNEGDKNYAVIPYIAGVPHGVAAGLNIRFW